MLKYFTLMAAVYSFHTHHHHEGIGAFGHHDQPEKVIYSGVDNIVVDSVDDFPQFVELKFEWNNRKFFLNLTQTWEWKNKGFDIHYTVLKRSSHLDGEEIEGAVMFTQWKVSKVFEAYLHSDGEKFDFLPSHREDEFKDEYHTIGNSTRFMASRRRRLINEFENCWPDQANQVKVVEIGYIADPDFVTAAANKRAGDGGTDLQKLTTEVVSINEQMNVVYRGQFRIEMKLSAILTQAEFTEVGGFPLGCTIYGEGAGKQGIDTYLENLQRWRQANAPQTFGEWQILTDCFPPPGTIGIAYVRAVCTNYGVGVNTFTNSGTSQTWLTVAHEVGHNIGAGHSFEEGQGRTGGIMDYGDGKIGGQYQFNEKYRFNDICGTLQATMAGAGSVNNCWKGKDLQVGEISYAYQIKEQTATESSISECLPAKAKARFKTTLYDCVRQTGGANGVTGTAIVEAAFCDLKEKPIFDFQTHVITQSDCQADTTSTCGNGVIEPGETCEPSRLPEGTPASCCVGCQFSTATQCKARTTSIDAAFMWENALYIFQGNEVYRYTGTANTRPYNQAPDVGYPRPITTNFPGLAGQTNYNNNVDAALVKPGSSELLIFKGLSAMRYDLTTNARLGLLDIEGAGTSLFNACGAVEAAMAFADTMWLFCESLLQIMTYTPATSNLMFVPDFDWRFPEHIVSHLDAALHDDVTGESVFWNGGYTMRWQARTHVGEPQQMVGLGAPQVNTDPTNPVTPTNPAPPANSQCADMCATCDPETPSICLTCRTIPSTPLPGGYCLSDNVVTYLGFDAGSDQDAQHIKGGTTTMATLSDRITTGLAAVFGGQQNTGLNFNGNLKLEMVSLADRGHAWNPNEKLRISAFFKPSAVPDANLNKNQRFVTFKDTNGRILLSIEFKVEPKCTPPEDAPPECACIEKQDSRYEFITYPDECQYGSENPQPYCYVGDGCTDEAFMVEGFDELGSRSGNKIMLCSGVECKAPNGQNVGDASQKQFKLEVFTPENAFSCFVNTPLQVGEWNKLYFEISNSAFVTGVNGLKHSRAFDVVNWEDFRGVDFTGVQAQNVDNSLSGGEYSSNVIGTGQSQFPLGEWEIGADANGINGVLDHFTLSIGEATPSTGANNSGSSSDASNVAAESGTIIGIVIPVLLILILAVVCYFYWDDIRGACGGLGSGSKNKGGSNIPMAPMARNIQQQPLNGTRKPGMSFDISRVENNVEWHYVENGENNGPVTNTVFMSLLNTQIKPDTLVWNGTMQDWLPAKDVPELKSKFNRPVKRTWKTNNTWKKTPEPAPRGDPGVEWNYVGPDGTSVGPITEPELIKLNLSIETYVWNGTTVNEWKYLKDTYLINL